ncbi:MAG: alpha/beta hydrolase, partial [Muribaculaceae bacterium]
LSKKGYNAFALIYRPDNAYDDLARAIEYIHDNAAQLDVRTQGYSLWGGSAGARMAATLGNDNYLRQLTGRYDIPQASAVIMQYTGYSSVSNKDAPTYACVGSADGIASWRTMQSRLQSLSDIGIATEFHVYDNLPHGFGLGTGTLADGCINDTIAFWNRFNGIASANASLADKTASSNIYTLDGIKRSKPVTGINIINHRKVFDGYRIINK